MGLFSRPGVDEIVARVFDGNVEVEVTKQYLVGVFRAHAFSGDYTHNPQIPFRSEVPEYLYRHPPGLDRSYEPDRSWTVHTPLRLDVACLEAMMVWEGYFRTLQLDQEKHTFVASLSTIRTRTGVGGWQFGYEPNIIEEANIMEEAAAIGDGVYHVGSDFQKRKLLEPESSFKHDSDTSHSLTTSWERWGREEELYQAVAARVIESVQQRLLVTERDRQIQTGRLNLDHPKVNELHWVANSLITNFMERGRDRYRARLNKELQSQRMGVKLLPVTLYEQISEVSEPDSA
ncbi:hypothetical protein HYV86_05405 [Candidatus Woesearchaeota archaeon]|nr:hypothetical protein [Candidatus Woesearchaeota archaeon]